MNIPRTMTIMLAIILFFAGCTKKVDEESRKAALEYFFGSNGRSGYMVSSWSDENDRAEFAKYRRVALGLDDSWLYWDEQIEVRGVGNDEYFIRYSVMFQKKSNSEIFTREEAYYSVGDNFWQPIILKSKDFTINLDSEEYKLLNSEALWKGDFRN